MAFRPPRSLLAVDNSEPLPLYTPRQYAPSDLETASVHSSAPSYVSAAPSYHSSVPPSHGRATDTPSFAQTDSAQRSSSRPTGSSSATTTVVPAPGRGLRPAPQFAAGFGNRVTSAGTSFSRTPSDLLSTPNSLRSMYNTAEWVPATEGLQSRHYHNVAKRRVSEALNTPNGAAAKTAFPWFSALMEAEANKADVLGNALARRNTAPAATEVRVDSIERGHVEEPIENPNVDVVAGPRSLSPVQLAGAGQDLAEVLPLSPHEDPDLVGEEAAARFRSQRLYRTYQQHENQIQQPQAGTGRPPLRPHQYTSLIPPDTPTTATASSATMTSSPSQDRTPTASPPAVLQTRLRSTEDSHTNNRTPDPFPTIPIYQPEFEEALRDQEARAWDFLLAQMADLEIRERDWKRFREDMDRRLASRTGLLWRGRPKRGGGGGKKWKTKVGLGT